MAEKQSDEITIRKYLLGNIDPKSELAESLDERMLTDRDFSALADCVEEEIIQDYLEDDLGPSERAAVEQHFLRPPERQERLRRAYLLNRHLAAREAEQEQLKRAPAPLRPGRPVLWTSYAGWAAALLLMISAGYLVNSQRALRSEVAQKTEDLERAHEQAAIARAKSESAFAALPQPAAQLNFYGREQGLVRGAQLRSLQQVAVGTKTLNVQLLLDGILIKPGCQVLLQSKAGKMAWFSPVPVSPYDNYSGVLVFNVPVDGIAPGEYQFKVSQCTSSEQTFPFRVSKP
jgi:hypothetical protein